MSTTRVEGKQGGHGDPVTVDGQVAVQGVPNGVPVRVHGEVLVGGTVRIAGPEQGGKMAVTPCVIPVRQATAETLRGTEYAIVTYIGAGDDAPPPVTIYVGPGQTVDGEFKAAKTKWTIYRGVVYGVY